MTKHTLKVPPRSSERLTRCTNAYAALADALLTALATGVRIPPRSTKPIKVELVTAANDEREAMKDFAADSCHAVAHAVVWIWGLFGLCMVLATAIDLVAILLAYSFPYVLHIARAIRG